MGEVHDHFDGSGHCVECEGPCRLARSDLLLSQLIRYTMEQHVVQGTMPNMLVEATYKDALEHRLEDWWIRARQTAKDPRDA